MEQGFWTGFFGGREEAIFRKIEAEFKKRKRQSWGKKRNSNGWRGRRWTRGDMRGTLREPERDRGRFFDIVTQNEIERE